MYHFTVMRIEHFYEYVANHIYLNKITSSLVQYIN
jgi:hypothetical protein